MRWIYLLFSLNVLIAKSELDLCHFSDRRPRDICSRESYLKREEVKQPLPVLNNLSVRLQPNVQGQINEAGGPKNDISRAKHAVTYEFSGGRFGDNLLTYLHAKWFSYQQGIQLFYKPFNYSKYLTLHEKEPLFSFMISRGKIRKNLKDYPDLNQSSFSYLYTCPYFPENPKEVQNRNGFYFQVDWKDPVFRKIALEMISPIEPLVLVEPPQDTIKMAIHVRWGEGYDTDHTRTYDALKLPPWSFYVEGLKKIFERLPDLPIYCHIFTDIQDPKEIINLFQEAFPQQTNVTFGYRHEGNYHDKNVLEDFFSLFNFDILIRPQSNFSIVPSLLKDYAILYQPTDYILVDGKVVLTEVKLDINEQKFNELIGAK